MSIKILLIDNYDSFVFNAHHLFQEADPSIQVDVVRNDDDFLSLLDQGKYHGVIVGPGPGSPEDDAYFGHSKQVILEYPQKGIPVLGICLGFQGMYYLFGGKLKKATTPVHGKISLLNIEDNGVLLDGVANGAAVMRYHSIMADLSQPVPECLKLTAFVEHEDNVDQVDSRYSYEHPHNGRELMAFEHKTLPLYAVQFHPESFATECGFEIARNFIEKCRKAR